MNLNHQIETVLETSLNSDIPIGVNEVMRDLSISKSAAYLLMQNCETWLKENNIEYTSSKLRRELNFKNDDSRTILRNKLSQIKFSEYDFSVQERRTYIILMLLESKYVRTNYIMEHFRISRNTCIQDVANIYTSMQTFNLILASGNYGYTLKGNQYDVYRLCLWIVSEILYELYPNNYRMALSLFNFPEESVNKTYQTLLKAMDHLNIPLNFEAGYIFSAAITLVKKRIYIVGLILVNNIPNYQQMNKSSYIIRNMLLKCGVVNDVLEAYYQTLDKSTCDDSEKLGITECLARMLICSCVETGNDLISIHFNKGKLNYYASKIVLNYEHYIDILFEDRDKLINAVTLNIECLLLRSKYAFIIYNPLTKEIRKYYRFILETTKNALVGIPYIKEPISDSEAILFSVNFLGWMYKSKRVTSQTTHILVACAGNIGTSILLQGQLEELLPLAKIHTTSLLGDISKISGHFDFIVTTVSIKLKDIPVLVVNAFLTGQDKYRIKKMIKNKSFEDLDVKQFIQDVMTMSKDFITSEDLLSLKHRVQEYFKINNAKIIYQLGGKPMLKDLITIDRVQIIDSVEDWRAAIRLAAKPLEEDHSINCSYTEAMIHSVETLGPYIVLAPGIALPHARPESGVNSMSMALLRVNKKVYFDKEKYANLFFILASSDSNSHIGALRELSTIFGDESAINKFMNADNIEELYKLI